MLIKDAITLYGYKCISFENVMKCYGRIIIELSLNLHTLLEVNDVFVTLYMYTQYRDNV